MKRFGIAITAGDPCGIGPQVLAKALRRMRDIKDAVFFVFAHGPVLKQSGFKPQKNVIVVDYFYTGVKNFKPGEPCLDSGRASFDYLKGAINSIKSGDCQALVTGPISKDWIRRAGFLWSGHTEYLADTLNAKRVEMVFISKSLKVILLTRHLPIEKVKAQITKKNIVECGLIAGELLKKYFKIRSPRIAVCGFNPHAGENGLFGREEIDCIAPALKQLNSKLGNVFSGPYPADTIFNRALDGAFDMVMAMYHDQGLIPFKLLEFDSGVNLSAGLKIIRTSPVHGTAFDIAAKNIASCTSMASAIELAYRLTKNRLG